MRITHFKIENFRNIRLAECTDPPDFMVICGGNGCGKSALLNALMTAKEYAGGYGNFFFDPRAVSADADFALISITLAYSQSEREFLKRRYGIDCGETDKVVVRINKGGGGQTQERSTAAHQLLSYYSQAEGNSAGFFDYIDAYRHSPRTELSSWDASFLSDDQARLTLGASGSQKFQGTKR
jgi:predicted ATP-binding protein involved in virulence